MYVDGILFYYHRMSQVPTGPERYDQLRVMTTTTGNPYVMSPQPSIPSLVLSTTSLTDRYTIGTIDTLCIRYAPAA